MKFRLPGLLIVLLLVQGVVSAQTREFTHTIVEVNRAIRITQIAWSPDSLWLAYFTHEEDDLSNYFVMSGVLHLYSPETGVTCDYPDAAVDVWFGNGEDRTRNTWLRDGQYLSLSDERALIITPCASEEDISDAFPQPTGATSIVAYSHPMNTLMLRTRDGFYLLNLDTGESQRLEGDINSFNFYGGKGSVSPSGTHFAFTLSGPGDTYVVNIATGEVTTVVDEPLGPGEDECCTTPLVPQWLSSNWLLASTQSLGSNGSYGQVLVNVTDGTLITIANIAVESNFSINAAYWQEEGESVVIWLRNQRGEFVVTSMNRLDTVNPLPDLEDVLILPEGVTLRLTGGIWEGRGHFETFSPIMRIRPNGLPSFAASAYHEDVQRLAIGGDHFVSIFDVLTGEWIEVLAPSGYSRFRVAQSWFSSNQWSLDGRHLVLIGRQQNMDALLVATIDELPQPVSTPQG